jgi:hypothetical protein
MNNQIMDKEIYQIADKLIRLKEAKTEGLELLSKVNTAVGIAEISLASLMVDNDIQSFKHKDTEFCLDEKSIIKISKI